MGGLIRGVGALRTEPGEEEGRGVPAARRRKWLSNICPMRRELVIRVAAVEEMEVGAVGWALSLSCWHGPSVNKGAAVALLHLLLFLLVGDSRR